MTADEPADAASPSVDFERFFELAVDVMVVTGPEGRFERVNPALARLLGVSVEEILASPWSRFVHPDDRDRSIEESEREFDDVDHRTMRFENRYVDVDGGVHWMEWNADLDPVSGLVYGIARDVTERHAAREALEAANAAAEAARDAAEAANLAKSEFLSRMSHELRTPLNSILGFSQLLELGDLDESQLDSVRQILHSGRHLLALIDEVLDIARIEVGGLSLSVEPVRVGDAVAEAVSLMTPLGDSRGISVTASWPDEGDDHVLADRRRLHQILVNYLGNAIKYCPEGSSVRVEVRQVSEGCLRLAVVDDGPGIPPEQVGLLFAPFERLGAEQTGVEGTGLGLAHSKALAEHIDGRVGVESVLGQGSSFWVELPIGAAPARALEGDAAAPGEAPRSDVSGTVLYIEDNVANTLLLERLLARRPSVTLELAMLGREGLERARELLPDLIALDLHLPDIPGETVLTLLRRDPVTAGIPVVVLSADATRRQVEQLLAMGAVAYLTKPLDVRRVLVTIDEHLGRTAEE